MSFFIRIMQKLGNVKTLSYIFKQAELIAKKGGEKTPSEEHFLLAAMDAPDGTVKRVFEQLGINYKQLQNIIQPQLNSDTDVDEEDQKPNFPYQTAVSGKLMMKKLITISKKETKRPLLGVHILRAIAENKQGPVNSVLELLDVDRIKMNSLIDAELEGWGKT